MKVTTEQTKVFLARLQEAGLAVVRARREQTPGSVAAQERTRSEAVEAFRVEIERFISDDLP